jgi:uncharacterized membrane protein
MNIFKLLFCILISIAPLVYLGSIWHTVPAVVPTHFNSAGEANGFSPRGMLWGINGFLSLLSIGLYLFFNNLHRVDPKRRGSLPAGNFANIADGLVLFISAINFVALLASTGHPVAMTKAVFPIIGLLFAFLGNMMYNVKPNYFVGIRLPWTLADDANWKATHRIAGVVWFLGGLLLTVGALILQSQHIELLMFAILVPMILIPSVYSFWFYKRGNSNNS